METLLQDLRYGLRSIAKNPGFSAALIMVLALGIGGTTAMFTLVYNVILRPLPFKNPEQLVRIGGAASAPGSNNPLDWWSQNQNAATLCMFSSGGLNLSEDDFPTRVSGSVVSASFFKVFESEVKLGRLFTDEDERPGFNRVAILSDRLWAQNYNRDPNIVGKTITLNGVPHVVTGVMSERFDYPAGTNVWVPRSDRTNSLEVGDFDQADSPRAQPDVMVGRLNSGVTLTRAKIELKAAFEHLREISAKSGSNVGEPIAIYPLQEITVREYRSALLALFAAVVFLLLIACANAMNLLLARAAARQKEISIRLCLGAGASRIIRQLLTEAVLFALISGMAGLLLAYSSIAAVRVFGPQNIPRISEVHINTPALFFALSVSLLIGVLFGLVPAIQLARQKLSSAFQQESIKWSGGFRRRSRNALVVLEVALALVLLIGAGLSIESFFKLVNTDPGFDATNVVTMSIDLPDSKYGSTGTAGSKDSENRRFVLTDFQNRLTYEISHRPGIVASGAVNQLPLGNAGGNSLYLDGPDGKGTGALVYNITGDYFGAMRIPVIKGRKLSDADTETAPKVIVISESLARLFWHQQNPIGKTMVIEGESSPREVVGMVRDVKQVRLSEEIRPEFYISMRQPYRDRNRALQLVVVARTDSNAKSITAELRSAVLSIDKDLPVFRVRTMEQVISDSTADYRFRGMLMTVFAVLSIILALAGVYAVVAHSVTSRTNEIGVRMAMGALPGNILTMILREGALLGLLGVVFGTGGSYLLNRLIANLLYGISPADPGTVIRSGLILIVGVLASCALPAVAASRIQPATALRYE